MYNFKLPPPLCRSHAVLNKVKITILKKSVTIYIKITNINYNNNNKKKKKKKKYIITVCLFFCKSR